MSWFGKMFRGSKEADEKPQTEGIDDKVEPSEADEVLPEDNRSLLLQLISKNGLSMGMDLSKVALPTFILEPRSLLEKLGDTVIHPEIFTSIPTAATPEERMAQVVRWYLSAYHVKPRGTKKPFNPVLGETFAVTFKAAPSTGCTNDVLWTAQQVSHHPPVSAFFARDVNGSIIMQGCFAPKSKFLGNSAASMGGGQFRIFLPQHNEVYYCNWPSVYVRGVLFGTLLMEVCGHVSIVCPKSNLTAAIEFEAKGFFKGDHHHVVGTIFRGLGQKDQKKGEVLYTLDGFWVGKTVIRPAAAKTTTGDTLFDTQTHPVGVCADDTTDAALDFGGVPNSSKPETRRMWGSRKEWKAVADAIVASDQDAATQSKLALEQYQRDLRAKRTEAGETFAPSLFELNEQSSEWEFIGPNSLPLPPVEDY